MLTFRDMRLTVYKRDSGLGMVALEARDPTVGNPESPTSEAGIRCLSFYFTLSEFEGLLRGRLSGCNDLGHNVRRIGECYTFYDMEFSTKARGVMHVPFVNLQIPHHVGLILLRAVCMVLRHCKPEGNGNYDPRREIVLSYATRDRWMRVYGQGTGEARLEFRSQDAADLYDFCLDKGGKPFKERIEQLLQIAKNGTWKRGEVGTVTLCGALHDPSGFDFGIYLPNGKMSMNGGLINHSRDGGHDWSIHT